MSAPRKIALFGGTFDPVHLGHMHIAGSAHQTLGLEEVRFLPCRISPHKAGQEPTPADDRLEMLRRATADLPWAVVDDCEVRSVGPSFSYVTAAAMRVRFSSARLFWIMGGDQWEALPQWRHPERLAACVEFVVFSRGDPPRPRDGYMMHALAGNHPASATAIREAFALGDITHPWLAPAVAEWMVRRRLYRS
ncbi:MAG: nicotinate (nicotinamide) nucleotide adenylyltransferase [Verrucomicrobiota bacterium]